MTVNVFDYDPTTAILKGVSARKEPATHNLTITADEGARFGLRDLARNRNRVTNLVRLALRRNSGLELLADFQKVGLTNSPQIASWTDRHQPRGFLWWFPSYEVQDEWEALRENGQVVFRFGGKLRPVRKHNKALLYARDDLDMAHGKDWHNAMSVWFTAANEIWARDPQAIPAEWLYRPAAAADPRETHDSQYENFKKCSLQELVYVGNVMRRYAHMLERTGDYG